MRLVDAPVNEGAAGALSSDELAQPPGGVLDLGVVDGQPGIGAFRVKPRGVTKGDPELGLQLPRGSVAEGEQVHDPQPRRVRHRRIPRDATLQAERSRKPIATEL